jgi:hypothetical protein
MTEITDWFQNNWVDLARLVVQCAILATVVRYGRKLLATLRASQEQVGALLKLSVSDTLAEQSASMAEPNNREPRNPESTKRVEPPAVNVGEPEPEPEPVLAGAFSRNNYTAEREQSLGGRVIGAQAPSYPTPGQRPENPSLTPWVSAPATEPVRASQAASSAARPNVSTWLQAPMSSRGVSPWRKVVRWLQAPAGHGSLR